MIPNWHTIRKICKEQIEFNTNKCCDPNTEEKDRFVAIGERQAFELILNLQGEESGIDE